MSDLENKKMLASILEYAKLLILTVSFALIAKGTVAEVYRIPSGSMENSLLIGDFILSNKIIYGARIPFTDLRLPGIRSPQPGDIITFTWPVDKKTEYVKRCVAVAGQTVEIKNKILYVDGEIFENPEHSKFTDLARNVSRRDNFGPITVGPNQVFAMGDNRDNSYDSRFWGTVPMELIGGKVELVNWSLKPDSSAVAYDLADLTSFPRSAFHDVGQFFGRIRWERFFSSVE